MNGLNVTEENCEKLACPMLPKYLHLAQKQSLRSNWSTSICPVHIAERFSFLIILDYAARNYYSVSVSLCSLSSPFRVTREVNSYSYPLLNFVYFD